MKRITDISKPSDQQVVDLVNLDNSLSLVVSDLDIGIPKVNDNLQISTCNTVLKLAKKLGAYGVVDIYYDRIDMSEFNKIGTPNIKVSANPTLLDVLNAFNTFYSSNISINEIDLSTTLATPTINGNLMTVKISHKSLVYVGECVINLKLL